jgi:hypothetical protein
MHSSSQASFKSSRKYRMSRQCTSKVRHPIVKVEENSKKAIFKNKDRSEFSITKVDGCLITEGRRSDYLVSRIGSVSLLIELKGACLEHACNQLLATAENSKIKGLLERRFGLLVVAARYPSFDSHVIKAKQHCAKKYKAGFHVVCGNKHLDIDQLAGISGL